MLAACAGEVRETRAASKPSSGGYPVAEPARAPDFVLRDQQGRSVRLSSLRGNVVVLSFLYTNCPDVCPLIADKMNRVLRQLGEERNQVRMLAVSVDPRGDTPRAVRRFVRLHRLLPEFRYLRGPRNALERVWKAYDVTVVPGKPDLVTHAASAVLVDPAGKRRFVYAADFRARALLRDVRRVLAAA